MKVSEFAKQATLKEGLKKSMSIAQVMEVLKVANSLLGGALYRLIREM